MSKNIDKTKPDVLRVSEYILEMGKIKKKFSILGAARSTELKGIDEYRIAEIMRDICLQPNGPSSMDIHTRVSNEFFHNLEGNWQLNATTYYSYLSYLSVKESEKSNRIAVKTMKIAIAAIVISIISPFIAA